MTLDTTQKNSFKLYLSFTRKFKSWFNGIKDLYRKNLKVTRNNLEKNVLKLKAYSLYETCTKKNQREEKRDNFPKVLFENKARNLSKKVLILHRGHFLNDKELTLEKCVETKSQEQGETKSDKK